MISFELFFEKCQAPIEVLGKYKDDPDVFISFTDIIQPRESKEGVEKYVSGKGYVDRTANKKTTRIGVNPLTEYDTPAAIFFNTPFLEMEPVLPKNIASSTKSLNSPISSLNILLFIK